MAVNERLQLIVEPVLSDLGIELYDLEYGGGVVRITVDREGGVDMEAIAAATRALSREFDRTDPLPGTYTLEVSSPGLERTLRRPAHFVGALGSTVAVRTHPHVEGDRRVTGVLRLADDDGITVDVEPSGAEEPTSRHLAYDDIERARTVFAWGPTPKPIGPRPRTRPTTVPQQEATSP